jgi:hypothetical protein
MLRERSAATLQINLTQISQIAQLPLYFSFLQSQVQKEDEKIHTMIRPPTSAGNSAWTASAAVA